MRLVATRYSADRVAMAMLAALVAVLLLTSPSNSDFFNEDAPRHALNGALFYDFFRSLPVANPVGWVVDYYLRYPSLSIGFYPPLFYLIEAGVYAVLGVSEFAAHVTVSLFTFALAAAAYVLARKLLPPAGAFAASVFLIGAPEMIVWEREVMLDVPVHAALLWAAYCAVRYCENGRQRWLLGSLLALLAGVYIKFNLLFILPALILAWCLAGRARRFVSPSVLATCAGVGVAAMPALALAARFSQFHADNLGGRVSGLPFWSVANWTHYATFLPGQFGWLPLVLAVVGAPVALRACAGRRWLAGLLLMWLLGGYLIFSAIRVHETRHDLMLLFPLALCAAAALSPWGRGFAAAALALACFLVNVNATPAKVVRGYGDIAAFVAKTARPGERVLFSGYRDGNFTFALRALDTRPDLTVIRANKYFLHFAVNRSWGIVQEQYDVASMQERLHDLGVGMIVMQRNFWTDLTQMAVLQHMAEGSGFRRVTGFPISGNLVADDGGSGQNIVDVYLPVLPPAAHPEPLEFDLPFLGRRIQESK